MLEGEVGSFLRLRLRRKAGPPDGRACNTTSKLEEGPGCFSHACSSRLTASTLSAREKAAEARWARVCRRRLAYCCFEPMIIAVSHGAAFGCDERPLRVCLPPGTSMDQPWPPLGRLSDATNDPGAKDCVLWTRSGILSLQSRVDLMKAPVALPRCREEYDWVAPARLTPQPLHHTHIVPRPCMPTPLRKLSITRLPFTMSEPQHCTFLLILQNGHPASPLSLLSTTTEPCQPLLRRNFDLKIRGCSRLP
ncbi:hypothetical protein K491DRAFT_235788 [Lophiostoma macrostomum CBS 122681]|uniref:Uncharacterized protein n=1 Tax=Lophiostoma macrostomum CBS 122681 TaxID=1314788 RepID=A0A6A6TJS7_9PLEO|nr:hypothetical protein K491DRAFT_235788 [Lophiostoma macrostomum CBS 122681]